MNDDELDNLFAFLCLFTIVTTRSDEMTFPLVRLCIANNQYSEHVDIFWIKISQRGKCYLLLWPSCLTNIPHRRISAMSMLQEQCLQTIKFPVASFAFGIIYSCHKISFCCSDDTLLYRSPRSHQV